MNAISKPHLVDLLRIFDKKRYLSPRIRYASVRSKPDLIKDLKHHFTAERINGRIKFFPVAEIPEIEYVLRQKHYLFDGVVTDVPRASREQPRFQILRSPITLYFPQASGDPPSKRKDSVASLRSPKQDIDSPSESSQQSEPSIDSDSTPT